MWFFIKYLFAETLIFFCWGFFFLFSFILSVLVIVETFLQDCFNVCQMILTSLISMLVSIFLFFFWPFSLRSSWFLDFLLKPAHFHILFWSSGSSPKHLFQLFLILPWLEKAGGAAASLLPGGGSHPDSPLSLRWNLRWEDAPYSCCVGVQVQAPHMTSIDAVGR